MPSFLMLEHFVRNALFAQVLRRFQLTDPGFDDEEVHIQGNDGEGMGPVMCLQGSRRRVQ